MILTPNNAYPSDIVKKEWKKNPYKQPQLGSAQIVVKQDSGKFVTYDVPTGDIEPYQVGSGKSLDVLVFGFLGLVLVSVFFRR